MDRCSREAIVDLGSLRSRRDFRLDGGVTVGTSDTSASGYRDRLGNHDLGSIFLRDLPLRQVGRRPRGIDYGGRRPRGTRAGPRWPFELPTRELHSWFPRVSPFPYLQPILGLLCPDRRLLRAPDQLFCALWGHRPDVWESAHAQCHGKPGRRRRSIPHSVQELSDAERSGLLRTHHPS